MAYVVVNPVAPAQVTDAAADGEFLDDVVALVVETVNLRPEAVAPPHFDVTRSSTPASAELATVTWVDTITLTAPSAAIDDEDPGLTLQLGGVTLQLLPPDDVRATLATGDVLRWHLSLLVDSVDPSGNPEADRYYVEMNFTGEDDNGPLTRAAGDSQELGFIAGYSMSTGGVGAGSGGDDSSAANQTIDLQRIHLSGWYIHDGEWSANGGDVRFSFINVRIYVEDGANSVTVSNGTLTAMICKG